MVTFEDFALFRSVILLLAVLTSALATEYAWGQQPRDKSSAPSAPAPLQPGGRFFEKFSFRPADPLNPSAFEHFYNMDYDRSIQEFTQVSQRHPDDPDAINHLLTVVLFHELYRIGALNPGEYANDSFVNAAHRPADKKTCDQIKSLVQRALAIGTIMSACWNLIRRALTQS